MSGGPLRTLRGPRERLQNRVRAHRADADRLEEQVGPFRAAVTEDRLLVDALAADVEELGRTVETLVARRLDGRG